MSISTIVLILRRLIDVKYLFKPIVKQGFGKKLSYKSSNCKSLIKLILPLHFKLLDQKMCTTRVFFVVLVLLAVAHLLNWTKGQLHIIGDDSRPFGVIQLDEKKNIHITYVILHTPHCIWWGGNRQRRIFRGCFIGPCKEIAILPR